jgi:aldehyde dehydrogenase (NAD+)
MTHDELKKLQDRQLQFFHSGKTRQPEFRAAQLKKLRQAIRDHEQEIAKALHADLGKSEFEAFTAEIGFVYEELKHVLAHLHQWAKPRAVSTPLLLQPAKSRIVPEPKGQVLIIGPWNYPFQLMIAPLIGAIAAGNVAVLKPSEVARETEKVIRKIIEKSFSPEFCAIVEGGVEATTALLGLKWDHVFFTGSIPVGRIVMKAAAEHLTPVTLELGGKSPCIVHEDADVDVTAKRLVWGKYYNAGQTCVAPDYIYAHEKIAKPLLERMKHYIREFFGEDPQQSPDFPRIINERHVDRLMKLVDAKKVYCGGTSDRARRYIAPTILQDVSWNDEVMADEIFGPILPVLTYNDLEQVFAQIRSRHKPLAAYVFTDSKHVEERVMAEVSFGGGCVNNLLVHLCNPNLPFGGVGASGMGAYHGEDSFNVFTHFKSVLKSGFRLDVPVRYPPYRESRLNLVRRLMR